MVGLTGRARKLGYGTTLALLVGALGPQNLQAQADDPDRVIRFGSVVEGMSVNPLAPDNVEKSYLVHHLFQRLVSYSVEDGYVGALAESWEYSDNHSEFTFLIRDDIHWSDGTPITAAEIAESFRILASFSDNPFTLVYPEFEVSFFERDGRDYVQFTLPEAAPLFIPYISLETSAVLPAHLSDHIDFSTDWSYYDVPEGLVYSGPYMVSEMDERSMMLLPNPHYDLDEVANAGVSVVWNTVRNGPARVRSVVEGHTDFTDVRNVGAEFLSTQPDTVTTKTYSMPVSQFYTFNVSQPPFDNRELRRAITYGLSDSLPKPFREQNSLGQSRPVIPASLTGSFDEVTPYWQQEDTASLIAQARDIMTGLGYSQDNPLRITLHANDTSVVKSIAFILRAKLSRIFVEAEVEITPWGEHFDRMSNTHDFTLGRWGWVYDYPHPLSLLETFHSDHLYNTGLLNDPDYDAIIEQMRRESDLNAVNDLSIAAQSMLIDQYAILPLHAGRRVILHRQTIEIGGTHISAMPLLNELVVLDKPIS